MPAFVSAGALVNVLMTAARRVEDAFAYLFPYIEMRVEGLTGVRVDIVAGTRAKDMKGEGDVKPDHGVSAKMKLSGAWLNIWLAMFEAKWRFAAEGTSLVGTRC